MLIQVEKAGERYAVSSALDDICVTETFTGFPAFIETPAGRCTLRLLPGHQFSETIKISICRPIDAVNDYSGQLVVTTTSKKTSIISLTFKDTDKDRAEAFLVKLIEVYNRDAMDDKNKVTGNTLIFLEERLDSISNELGFVEKHLARVRVETVSRCRLARYFYREGAQGCEDVWKRCGKCGIECGVFPQL